MIPPAIAAVFDFPVAVVTVSLLALPAVVADDSGAVTVTVEMREVVTVDAGIVIVIVDTKGAAGGVTSKRSKKSDASSPALVIVKTWEASGRTGDLKKSWLY